MPQLKVEPYTLRPIGGDRLVRGYRRPVDLETYVVESGEVPDTHGQVQLANFYNGKGWCVWYNPAWMPLDLRLAIADARNAPRAYYLKETINAHTNSGPGSQGHNRGDSDPLR